METMLDATRRLRLDEKEGFSYDFALPQPWWNDFFDKVGRPPWGIVWAYDKKSSIFGEPYALNMYAWIMLGIYNYKNRA